MHAELFRSSKTISELSEFASSMVYLMWHARKTTKNYVSEQSLAGNDLTYLMWQSRKPKVSHYSPLSVDHSLFASPAFKKFCFQVLQATQLKESAIYLSLKYIAILLQSNPTIEGAEGSEYRLFIVALMLANKFLDDNTFTNKTWSDISGMKVNDLNIMESEFLEALDYNLFIKEADFNNWKLLLEDCYHKLQQLAYYPEQRQKLILMILQTIGLNNDYFYQPNYYYYQHSQQYTVQQYPITNLSQSSWDPLAYSLNRCQEYYQKSYMSSRPISWGYYN